MGAETVLCALAGAAVRVGAELVPGALRPDSGLCGKGTVHSCRRHLGGNGEKCGELSEPFPCHPSGARRWDGAQQGLCCPCLVGGEPLCVVSGPVKIPSLSRIALLPCSTQKPSGLLPSPCSALPRVLSLLFVQILPRQGDSGWEWGCTQEPSPRAWLRT